jgi:hypothetical protein
MITSTSDIAIRSGLKNPEELKMNHYYTIDEAVNLTIKEVSINGDDLQRVNNVS